MCFIFFCYNLFLHSSSSNIARAMRCKNPPVGARETFLLSQRHTRLPQSVFYLERLLPFLSLAMHVLISRVHSCMTRVFSSPVHVHTERPFLWLRSLSVLFYYPSQSISSLLQASAWVTSFCSYLRINTYSTYENVQ